MKPAQQVLLSLILALAVSCSKDSPRPFRAEEVITAPVEQITSRGAVVGGKVISNSGSRIVNRGVAWDIWPSSDLASLSSWWHDEINSVDPFSHRLDGLVPATTYFVRAWAHFDGGDGIIYTNYGKQVSFRTLSEVPLILLATMDQAYVEYQFGTTLKHGLCWSTSEDPTIADSFQETSLDSLTLRIANLKANTTYYVRAYFLNASGAVSYGNQSEFTTGEPLFSEAGTIADIVRNEYRTITIGSQTWMAENLRTTHYANGDEIPRVNNLRDREAGGALSDNPWLPPEAHSTTYNGFAITDDRGLCPMGWHVPDDADWQTLVDFLGGADSAGGKMKLFDLTYWRYPNVGATNESGFSAWPVPHTIYVGSGGGGFYFPGRMKLRNEVYSSQGIYWETFFWSSTHHPLDEFQFGLSGWGVSSFSAEISEVNPLHLQNGLCVRCIKD